MRLSTSITLSINGIFTCDQRLTGLRHREQRKQGDDYQGKGEQRDFIERHSAHGFAPGSYPDDRAITTAAIGRGATTSSAVEKSKDPRHFERWHCPSSAEAAVQARLEQPTPRHDKGIAEKHAIAKLPRGDRDLGTNMWQFAADRRMMIAHAPYPGMQLVAQLGHISARDCYLRDKAIVPDEASAMSLRAPPNMMLHVARISTLSGQSV